MSVMEVEVATATQARELTDRIKVAVEGSWQLIKQAYTTRAWEALGYSSWDDYCTREFGTSRLRLPREERQEVVASLREIGMSTRAIAAATGDSYKTVQRDLGGGTNVPPEPAQIRSIQGEAMDGAPDPIEPEPPRVTGIDGKSYAAQPARMPNRPQLPAQFSAVANELTKIVARVEKLRADDRFRSNRGAIADQAVPQLRRAVEVLSDLMNELCSTNNEGI